MTALGVGCASTGSRADLLVCDDVVDVKALASRAERDRVKQLFRDNLVNLLEPDGRLWNLFTPWHPHDLNAELKANPSFAVFRRAVGDDLTPVWPERWPRERLEERRAEVGSASFARGYRLVPVADDEVPIKAAWVRFWTDESECDRAVLAVDPAVSTKPGADASALVVLGRRDNEIRCLEATARRVSAPDLVALMDDADRRWRPDAIVFEANAAFAGIKDLLARHARFGPKVLGVTNSRSKDARVAAFAVVVQGGAFRLKGATADIVDAGQRELYDEMTTYPHGEHDDLLDAAAFGTEWLYGNREPRVWNMGG